MIANTVEAWSERARIAATSAEAALWSERGQRDRYAAVLGALKPQPGELFLDYGCGTGALSDRLARSVRYIGYDFSPAMVARAKREHPGRRFVSTPIRHPVHLTAVIGTFNLLDGWTQSQTFEKLGYLWRRTWRALAASLYAGTDKACLVYGEDELCAFVQTCEGVSDFAVWRHRQNDLLLVLAREDPSA